MVNANQTQDVPSRFSYYLHWYEMAYIIDTFIVIGQNCEQLGDIKKRVCLKNVFFIVKLSKKISASCLILLKCTFDETK